MYLIKDVIDNSHCLQENITDTIFIQPSIPNKYHADGFFHRIVGKDQICMSTCFQIVLHLHHAVTYVHHNIIVFPIALNAPLILKLYSLEGMIFQKGNILNKPCCFSIYSHMLSGCMKIKTKRNANEKTNANKNMKHTTITKVILQISGIWESPLAQGLVYKFLLTS